MATRLATCIALALFSAIFLPVSAHGKEGETQAAFLFAYYPKESQRALFDEGYRRHLDWHRQKEDPLVWYAWDVSSGERTGLFIDGAFGLSFGAFDHRVELAGDAADFSQTTAPFADLAFRSFYRLRADLSTGQPLEEKKPSPNVEVIHYVLRAGMSGRFEGVLAKLREALEKKEGWPDYTWYQLISGGDAPGYMLMITRSKWADFGSQWQTIESVITAGFPDAQAAELLEGLSAAVLRARSETWRYRKDLSYFPEP